MFKRTNIFYFIKGSKRLCCTKVKPLVKSDETVIGNIQNELYKPRHHPGVIKVKTVVLPDNIIEATQNVIEDYPLKSILKESAILNAHLKGRHLPIEDEQFNTVKQKVFEKVLAQESNVEIKSEEDEKKLKQKVQDKVISILKHKVYHWTPIEYNAFNSLKYLFGRSAMEYSSLVRIFTEINARDCDFKPKSVFDFGSGVGSVIWAVNLYWKKYIFEYFNVDSSPDMNDLSQLLLQGGRGTKKIDLKGVFYRQFLPASNRTYDLVVSAYSLIELPNFHSRMETILNLWNKTEKYLIVVENGTNAGFKAVNEVRDFILQIEDRNSSGHAFSPCPHDQICPRFITDDTPCNFEATYASLPIGAKSEIKRDLYSYVVLRKGPRDEKTQHWPRVVRETLVRSKHTICRVCTAHGKLQEVIFTASKHGKLTYHCARATKWGDRLPVTLQETENAQ